MAPCGDATINDRFVKTDNSFENVPSDQTHFQDSNRDAGKCSFRKHLP